MNMKRIIRFIPAVIIAVVFWTATATATAQQEPGARLLSDGYVFAGVDGKLIEAEDGRWLFEFETGLSDGKAEVKAGQSLVLLKTATLEKITADAKERVEARYRLWGKVTRFEDKNYIFAVYFLGLRKVDRPESHKQKDSDAKNTQTINAPNDVLDIPDDIVARLQTSEVLPVVEAGERLELKQDTVFADRAGFIVKDGAGYVFKPDGFGRGVEGVSLELLPCASLEDALGQMRGEPSRIRFNVAGILTMYDGTPYLLLQRATRVYSYGNFGR